MRPTGGPGLNTQSPHAPHALTLLASLASFHTRSPRCSLALRAARLACSARFAHRLASAGLRSRFAASLAPATSPACFARLAGCSFRSTHLSRCSRRSSSLLLPSLASLGPLETCLLASSARRLACLCSRVASLVSSPAARSARRLDCGRRWLLAAGGSVYCLL